MSTVQLSSSVECASQAAQQIADRNHLDQGTQVIKEAYVLLSVYEERPSYGQELYGLGSRPISVLNPGTVSSRPGIKSSKLDLPTNI